MVYAASVWDLFGSGLVHRRGAVISPNEELTWWVTQLFKPQPAPNQNKEPNWPIFQDEAVRSGRRRLFRLQQAQHLPKTLQPDGGTDLAQRQAISRWRHIGPWRQFRRWWRCVPWRWRHHGRWRHQRAEVGPETLHLLSVGYWELWS